MTTEARTGYAGRSVAGIGLPVDETWEIEEVEGGAVLTQPAAPSGGFRPNLVLRRLQAPEGVSMARESTVAFSADRALLAGTQFISDDVWPQASQLGRMHVTIHRVADHSVVAQRWLLPLGPETLEATASYTTEQAGAMEPVMRYMVTHIVDAGRQDRASTARVHDAGSYPGREPLTDAEASEAYGEGVEELNKIRTVEPWSSRGPHLSMDVIDIMALYAQRRRLGRLQVLRHREEVKALVAADLMLPDGAWNEAGLFATDGFRDPRVSIEVDAGHGATRSRLDLKVGNLTAIAVAGPEIQTVLAGTGMSTTSRQLDIVRVEGVPGLIAQWVGLGPAWTVGTPVVMGGSEFAELLHSGGAVGAAQEAPEGFERFWGQPWFEWSVKMAVGSGEVTDAGSVPRDGVEMSFVNAGRAGHFHYRYEGESVRLTPAPSFSVWMELLAAYQDVLIGGPTAAAARVSTTTAHEEHRR